LQTHSHQLSFKTLNVDIPTSILVCAGCRRAYCSRRSLCAHCGSASVI
jgi:rRNA maturation endonuclease Nob1